MTLHLATDYVNSLEDGVYVGRRRGDGQEVFACHIEGIAEGDPLLAGMHIESRPRETADRRVVIWSEETRDYTATFLFDDVPPACLLGAHAHGLPIRFTVWWTGRGEGQTVHRATCMVDSIQTVGREVVVAASIIDATVSIEWGAPCDRDHRRTHHRYRDPRVSLDLGYDGQEQA